MALSATLVCLLSFAYTVILCCVHFYEFKNFFWILIYFITFTPKCFVAFAPAVAAISAELRATLQTKSAKFYNFCAASLILRTTANSAQNSAESRNCDPTSLATTKPTTKGKLAQQLTERQSDSSYDKTHKTRNKNLNP